MQGLFAASQAREDEDAVSIELVKIYEPYDMNWWLTREAVFLSDADMDRRMHENRGRRSGFFVNWKSVEYFSMAHVDRNDMYVQ